MKNAARKLTVDVTDEGLGSGTPGSSTGTGRAPHFDAKIFVGGLSWETSDAKLKQYFENFARVEDAYVSYDRKSGRPRGFGFVTFEDPAVVDKVVAIQHTIDRREVEAKRALPKEESPVSKDMQAAASGQRTKKIFVGGLAGTVDEAAFREYFEKYGAVDDAVVMYDQHNHRPRGFGFITFVEEKSVDAVFAEGFIQTIHNKEIEIKRAIPRETGVYPSPKALYRSPQDRYGHRTPGSAPGHAGGFRRDSRYMMPSMHPIRGIEHGHIDMSHGVVTGIPAGYMSPPPMLHHQVGMQTHGHPVPPPAPPQHPPPSHSQHHQYPHHQSHEPRESHQVHHSSPSPPSQGLTSPYNLRGTPQQQQTTPGQPPSFQSQLSDVGDISLQSVSQALEQLAVTPGQSQHKQATPGAPWS
jgi:RNA-binding protein Musashi